MLAASTVRKSGISQSFLELCFPHTLTEVHVSAIVKRCGLNCKKNVERSRLLSHIDACQRLFKWLVILTSCYMLPTLNSLSHKYNCRLSEE